MTAADLAVVLTGFLLIAALAWVFFAPGTATSANVVGGRQVVDVTVKGGCSPSPIRAEAVKPVRLRLHFHRRENSDFSRVVFPDLSKSASLEAFSTATLDLDITEPGEYFWACGMNMLHGTLVAEAPGGNGAAQKAQTAQTALTSPKSGGAQVAKATRGVSQDNRETAWAVRVGPRTDGEDTVERAEFVLAGALRNLPTDAVRAETPLQAVGGVDSASVNVGAERAIGTGTDVATEAADITLMSGELRGLVTAISLSTPTLRNITQLVLAFGYNVAAISVAAGLLYPFTGALLSPLIAAAAMTILSLSVVLNSARLDRCTPPVLAAVSDSPVRQFAAAGAR